MNVPTERLRSRIEGAIAELQDEKTVRPYPVSSSARSWFGWLSDYSFSQRAFGCAAVAAAIVVTLAVSVKYLKRGGITTGVEIVRNDVPPKTASPQSSPDVPRSAPIKTPGVVATVVNAPKKTLQRHSTRETGSAKLFPRERDYIKTIAALDATIKSDNRPMRPGLQVEYEHNLAVLNQAIAVTRVAAQSNPNDPDAAQFMFSAYQSKVELLTQVADARLFNTQRK